MAITHMIPQVWSGAILRALQKSLVYGQPGVVNRDYEGDIAEYGDTVKIESIGDPTIIDYTKNTDLPSPETLTDAERTLTIDAAKAFNFQVDDIDKRQARLDFQSEALNRAAYRLKDAADQYLAGKMVAGAIAGGNIIGTDTETGIDINVGSSANAYDQLVKMRVMLDENNVPTDGRFVIVPAWFEAALTLDPRFVGLRGLDGNTVLLNGMIGQTAGFNVLKSNNVPFDAGSSPPSGYSIVAGIAGATSYAEQITKVEGYRPQLRFADALKGLHLYGGSVVRNYELAVLFANDAAGLQGAGPQDPPA